MEARGTVLATQRLPDFSSSGLPGAFYHMRFMLTLPPAQAHVHTHGDEVLPQRIWRVGMPVCVGSESL